MEPWDKRLLNLRPNVWSATNQPIKRGRNIGSKNRKTYLQEGLSVETDETLPDGTVKKIDQVQAITYAMIKQAKTGDTQAAAWVFDGLFGKIANVQVNELPKPAFDTSKLTDTELATFQDLIYKAMPDANEHIEDATVIDDKNPAMDGQGKNVGSEKALC